MTIDFFSWFRHQGGFFSLKLTYRHDKTIALEHIHTNETIIKVPLDLTMNISSERFKVFKKMANVAGLVLDAVDWMALYLIHEKFVMGDNSFFWPYLCMLPEKMSDPLHWDKDVCKELLHGTNLYPALLQRLNLLQNSYKLLSGIDWITFDSYLWARSIISSRSFPGWMFSGQRNRDCADGLVVEGSGCFDQEFLESPVLVPGFDLLNHNALEPVSWISADDQVCVQRRKELRSGEEFFNNYGQKTNGELLLGYGFAMENNPFDSFDLEMRIVPDPLLEKRQRMLEIGPLQSLSFSLTLKNPLPSSLLSAVSVFCATERELDTIQGGQLSIRNRLVTLQSLDSTLRNKLSCLPKKRHGYSGIYVNGQEKILFHALEALNEIRASLVYTFITVDSIRIELEKDSSAYDEIVRCFPEEELSLVAALICLIIFGKQSTILDNLMQDMDNVEYGECDPNFIEEIFPIFESLITKDSFMKLIPRLVNYVEYNGFEMKGSFGLAICFDKDD